MAHLVRPWQVRYVKDGKRVPKGAPGAKKVKGRARKWYGQGIPGLPPRKRVPLASDKAVARQLLADLVKKAERKEVGLNDPYEQHRNRPLAEHLADFEAELRVRPRGKRKRPPSAERVRRVMCRVRTVLDGCRFHLPGDIAIGPVLEFLQALQGERDVPPLEPGKEWFKSGELAALLSIKPNTLAAMVRRGGLAAKGTGGGRRYPRATAEELLARARRGLGSWTASSYGAATKMFTHWLAKRERIPKDPLADLPGAQAEGDHRRDRRSLSEEELRQILDAARASDRVFRGLAGRDRCHLYLTAMATGFRAQELSYLTPDRFDLQADPPTANLRGDEAKNGRTAAQPLRADVAEALAAYLAGRAAGEPVWPGTWFTAAAEMLRHDLQVAGVPFVVEGPDGPLYADFHALRHSYVALLDKAGVSLKQAMHLARHSDPKLTMARYGKPQLHDLAAAVEAMPAVLPGAPETTAPAELTLEQVALAGLLYHALAVFLLAPAAPLVAPQVAPLSESGEDGGGRRGIVPAEKARRSAAATTKSERTLVRLGTVGD
jgi:integrase